MGANTYDPKLVIATFGPLPLLGFADGAMIEVAMQGDGASSQVGTQGEAVVIKSHNRAAEATCRFMGTGLGRATLSALHAHFLALNLALPFTLTSIDTGEQLAGGVAVIKNYPDTSFGDDAPVREVIFVIGELTLSASAA